MALALWAGNAFAQLVEPAEPPTAAASAAPAESAEVLEARRHYAQGVVFYRSGRYEEAIAEFTEAWALWQNPTILYSLGQANERLLRVPRAIGFYRRYLEAAPPEAANRGEVEDTIRGLSALLADVRFESNVPASIFANDEEVGRSPGTIQLATGRYEIELRARGREPSRQTVTIAARTERTLTFELRRATPGQVIVREERGGLAPAWFWTGAGVTAASVISAVVFGVLTLQLSSEFEDDPIPSRETRDDGQRFAVLTDVSIGSAIVFGTATVLLLLNTDWRGDDEEKPISGRRAEVNR